MSTVRLRRLQADYEKMRDYVNRHPRLQLIQADGTPPERYQLEYRIRSLRQTDDDLSTVKSHMVEITLPLNYPRMPPQCRMLTPIFHPNIAPHAICIGDHWSPGEPLWSIVARIGEMIAYQSYNTKSPLNGEAARWVDQHVDELPLDPVSMMPDDRRAPSPRTRAPRPARPCRRRAAVAPRRVDPPPTPAAPRLRPIGRPPSVADAAARPPRPSAGSPARIAARSPDGGPSWPASSCDALAARRCSDAHCETWPCSGIDRLPPMPTHGRPDRSGRPRAGRVDLVGCALLAEDDDVARHPACAGSARAGSPCRRRIHGLEARATTAAPIGSIRRHREVLAVVLRRRGAGLRAGRGARRPGRPPRVQGLSAAAVAVLRASLLGLRCPGCGLTRSIIHLAEGDWRASWRSHRLGGLMAAVLIFQVPYRLLALRRPETPLIPPRWQAALGTALIVLLIVNWLADVVTGRLASV